ncbi:hypothetical protein U1Q18_040306 [Sarracenia purpurea var. burkii]
MDDTNGSPIVRASSFNASEIVRRDKNEVSASVVPTGRREDTTEIDEMTKESTPVSGKCQSPLGDEGLEGSQTPLDNVFCNVAYGAIGRDNRGISPLSTGRREAINAMVEPIEKWREVVEGTSTAQEETDSEGESDEGREIAEEDLVYRQTMIDKVLLEQRLDSIQKKRGLRLEKGKGKEYGQYEEKGKGPEFVQRAVQYRSNFRPTQGLRGGGRGGGRVPFRGQMERRSYAEASRGDPVERTSENREEKQAASQLFDKMQHPKTWASVVTERKPRGVSLDFVPTDTESILETESILNPFWILLVLISAPCGFVWWLGVGGQLLVLSGPCKCLWFLFVVCGYSSSFSGFFGL